MKSQCDRCNKESNVTTVSFMNTDEICLECAELEKQHPRYVEAKEKEFQECKRGNYNYPGLFAGQKWPF